MVAIGSNYEQKVFLKSSKEIATFVEKNLDLSSLAEEQFWILAFNTQAGLIGLFKVSQGMVDCSVSNTSGIFKRLLMTNLFQWMGANM